MRWGLIGTRGLVDRGGLNAFDEAENAELVAVLSSDADRATEFGAEHGIETATDDIASSSRRPASRRSGSPLPPGCTTSRAWQRSRPASTS